MFFNSLNKKLKKSYSVVNPEIGKMVFPNGESEYIYVGTILNTLFKNRDVFELIKVYVSAYTYYKTTMGNTYKTYLYAKKKANNMLLDYEIKDLVALVMFNLTASKVGVSDPIAAVHQYKGFVNSYLETVDEIAKHKHHFEPKTADAGSQNSPLLVDGVCGVKDYINSLNISDVDEVTYKRTSTLHLTDNFYRVNYAIDEYTLYNAKDLSEIAKLWFNIYGTENTDVLPACLSNKEPFSAKEVTAELLEVCIEECKKIDNILQNENISYEQVKLATATFVYFYIIWIFSFSLRAYQCNEVEKIFVESFSCYIKQNFDDAPYKTILEIEATFEDMLKRVDHRIRNSYHENNKTLIDDGLSDEYLAEFILNAEVGQNIKTQISKIMMENWIAIGRDFDERYLT